MEKKTEAPRSVIVIGGGPGGYSAAIRAAQLGAKVTLIEADSPGGTCLNRGCMPTKALLHSAEAYLSAKNSASLGVEVQGLSLNWAKVQENRANVVKRLTDGVRGLIRLNRISYMSGSARFVDKKAVAVGGETLGADSIIIAAGSVPAKPPIPGSDCPACIDSTACLSLEALPASLCVVGGGVVGLELATAYASFGADVTVLEAAEDILPAMDRELVARLKAWLARRGVKLTVSARVGKISPAPGGARVSYSSSGKAAELECEKVLLCTGRSPNTASLALEKCGIKTEKGFISVSDTLETACPGVYAVGDCTGKMMYAHAAMAMGRLSAENAMGAKKAFDASKIPACAYIGPELASLGLTEEQCKKEGIPYKLGSFPTAANGRSLVLGETDGLVKVIAGAKHGEILGVHILAPNAAELISQAALAIGLEATLDELCDTVHCHPTVSESLHEAALAAEGRAIHYFSR